MSAHEQRVIDELAALQGNIDRLDAFTDTKRFNDLEWDDRDLLLQQLTHMREYGYVLAKRIERFKAG